MAKSLTVRKKKTVRAARRVNGFALMPTDSWFKAKHFVHYEIESKDWLTKIKDYIRNNFDKKTVADVYRLPDWKIGNYSHWATTAALMDKHADIVPEDYKTGIVKWVQALAEEGKTLAAEKKAEDAAKPKNVYTPTIQERIEEQSQEYVEDIDTWLEGFIVDRDSFDPKGFDFKAHFGKKGVSQAHARKMRRFYENALDDFKDLENMPTANQLKNMDEKSADLWNQLKEGYKHLKKADIRKYTEAITSLLEALDFVIEQSNAKRKPRVAKPKSVDKVVAKLKYLKVDDKYKLTSVNPTEIVGATELWVFNVKTRKLGKYVAEDNQQFQVKGTTLLFFDEQKSIQKTLRKPEEQLKAFKSAGKVALRKFLDDIPTTETKMNGRFNIDTLILRVS